MSGREGRGLTVRAIRRAVRQDDLRRLGQPGEVEWWFWEGDESRYTIDNPARVAWDEAVSQRVRHRAALYALGYEHVTSTAASYTVGHVLPTYTETWIGQAGTSIVLWNA